MSTQSKIRIYKTCVRSVFTYDIEIIVEISKTKRMVNKKDEEAEEKKEKIPI